MKHTLYCLRCKKVTRFEYDGDYERACSECGIPEGIDQVRNMAHKERTQANTRFERKLNEKQIKEVFGGGNHEELKTGSG